MNNLQQRLHEWKKLHFVKYGLPLLVLVVGGSFLTIPFQKIKYDEKEKRINRQILDQYGIITKIDIEEEYKKITEANVGHEWINVRGPRYYEDNTEFMSLRAAQEKNFKEALERGEKRARGSN